MPANLQTISAHLLPEPLQAARHALSGRTADVAHSPCRGSAQRSPSMISQKKQGEGLQENGGGGDATYSTCFCLARLETTGWSECAKLLDLVVYLRVLKSSL